MSVPGCANKDESGLRMPQACSNKSDLRFERFVDPWPWAGAKTQTGLELVTFSVVKKNDRRQPGGDGGRRCKLFSVGRGPAKFQSSSSHQANMPTHTYPIEPSAIGPESDMDGNGWLRSVQSNVLFSFKSVSGVPKISPLQRKEHVSKPAIPQKQPGEQNRK